MQSTTNRVEVGLIPITPTKVYNLCKTRLWGDSDVIIIAISKFISFELDELCIELGAGKTRRWITAHRIVSTLGEDICSASLCWYTFTSCDTVSPFAGKGKAIAWQCWKVCPDCTKALKRLSDSPGNINDEDLAHLQQFAILMYG